MGEASQNAGADDIVAGRYVIENLLGEGGMGAVYKVRQLQDDRALALKRLRIRPGANAAALHLLFQREFYWLAQLAHPRIIEVYDYGVDQGGAFYTMELLDGEDLREGGQRQSVHRICEVLRDVASALAILHSRRLVHRDVSPRNIRCTTDGRAKLIDFGAMVPNGVCKQILGTAVCVAPESMELLSLDGRTDLYSLGVLAYWMLTGHYPYPATNLGELRYHWQGQVAAPRALNVEVPEQLSDLVMQLIAIDRAARPATAAEVIDRLNAIAGLTVETQAGLANAYISTPVLVGRDAQVQQIRSYLSPFERSQARAVVSDAPYPPSARRVRPSKGIVLSIRGESGSGRTRMLDESVLEAKLLGATIVRAGTGDAAGDYSVVRALADQLFVALPEAAKRAAALYESALASFFGTTRLDAQHSISPVDHRKLQLGLRDWIRSIARRHALMFVIDDFDRIDEPSAALLGILAYEADRESLALVVARDSSVTDNLAVNLIEQIGEQIDLAPLSQSEVTALMRSVFGAAEQLTAASHRLYELSSGNPRALMELLEQLLAQGHARYEAGRWLFTTFSQSLLPSSLQDALAVRMQALPEDARGLAEALSLTDPSWLLVEDYAELTDHQDTSRMLRSVIVLSQAGLISADGDKYRLAQP